MLSWMAPGMTLIAVYALAAILPAVLLMRYIYRKDQVEKEPTNLLLALVGRGVLAALAAIVAETVGEFLLSLLPPQNPVVYCILLAFFVVAAAEEGCKYFFLKRRTWKDPNFNYRFDGIVYAVFVSLGFAAFENVKYVFSYGLAVALPRALLAVPGHMGFAVFMGIFYGRAKLCETMGEEEGKRRNLWGGYLSAVLLHGFYDACAMIGSGISTALFAVFVIIMYIVVLRKIKQEAASDTPV